MSDNKPNKIIEPSAFDKWWAEVTEWRRQRLLKKRSDVLRKSENFNETRYLRGTKRIRASRFSVINLFVGIAGVVAFFASMLFGLIGILWRIAVPIGVIVIFMFFLIGIARVEDAAVEETTGEVHQEQVSEFDAALSSLKERIEDITKDWHIKFIEIRTKNADGEESVIEFGTKQPVPPEPPEAPSNE